MAQGLGQFLSNNLPPEFDPEEGEEASKVKSSAIKWNTTVVEKAGDEETIFSAVAFNDTDMIDRQLRQGVDVNFRHQGSKYTVKATRPLQMGGYTPIHVACLHSELKTIDLLLERGADINIQDSTCRTPLHIATAANRLDVVTKCLENGADVNSQTSSGQTPLIQAIINNCFPVVQKLLEYKADFTLRDNKGSPPLFLAASYLSSSASDIVRVLLEAGCDPDVENILHATPLMAATTVGKVNVMKMLIDAGADINHVDNKKRTAFDMSCNHSRMTKAALFLVQNGADINKTDISGLSPLKRAIQNRSIGLVMFLLRTDCIRDPDLMKSENIQEMCNMFPPFKQFLEQEFLQPWSLLRICRYSIRNTIPPGRLKYVENLTLPKSVINYIKIT